MSTAGAAAGAAGGGGSPVTLKAEIDLSHAFNRAADSWFNVFTGTSQVPMNVRACAYPGSFSEEEIAEIRQYTYPSDQQVRWNMSIDSWMPGDQADWNLYVGWESRYFEYGGETYYFIEDAVAWVDLYEPGRGWKFYIDASFGQPNFYNNIANMIVDFHVKVTDGGDDVWRDTHRRFRIYGDGTRETL